MVSKQDRFKNMKCIFMAFLFMQNEATKYGGTPMLNISQGIYLAETFYVDIHSSFQQCAVMCLHFNLCKSVNFDQETRKCYLHQHNTISDPFHDVHAPISMYYIDYNGIPEILGGACGNHSCSVYDRCIPTSDKEYVCLPFIHGEWACHHWTSQEVAVILTPGNSMWGKQVCEAVGHRSYHEKCERVGCYCCKFLFKVGVI